ncbi:uncharacterized protein LOC113465101 [Ceratina calcarata]|uniref:Uncharacterized protein LOC113465028 n=1 Tax=Ceratina calcarata TaxID=156304 RepID=A0AAJ7SBD5_9HYME|nr:uncharacterized protein LOC113465028 [Ceratina calcarata]XP_026674502.1 uncharacterized protein LOC113465101 [Ceratina calcarata]
MDGTQIRKQQGRTRKRRPNKRTRRSGAKERSKRLQRQIIKQLKDQLPFLNLPKETSHPERPCYSPVSQASTIIIESDSDVETIIHEEINTDNVIKVANHAEIPNELLNRCVKEVKLYMQG